MTAIKMRTVAAATTMTVMTINRHDSDDRDVDADANDGGDLICSVSLVKKSRVLEGKFRISKTTLLGFCLIFPFAGNRNFTYRIAIFNQFVKALQAKFRHSKCRIS